MPGGDQRIVGREALIARLAGVVEQAGSGAGDLVLLDGEAGIGKSRLVAHLAEQADARGVRVLQAFGAELERRRPFGPLVDALRIGRDSSDDQKSTIARLLSPDLASHGVNVVDGPGAQFQVVAAIADLVERLALEQPTLLVIEDLHWVDPSTLLVLRSLAARVDTLPLAIVVTLRPAPRAPEIDRLVAELETRFERIVIPALSLDAVVQLVTGLVARRPGDGLLRATSRAGGNPLYVTELVGGLAEQGRLDFDGDRADVATDAEEVLPSTLANTILRRLSLVPTDVLDVLRIAAVLGTTFSLSDLALVLDRPAATLLSPLEEATRSGVLGEAGHRLRFRHDLVRDALYESMPMAIRAGLHQAAGRALASNRAGALQVAEHLALGAPPGDTSAVAWLAQAGRDMLGHAPEAASQLLERALALAPPHDPERPEMLADLVMAEVWCGRSAESAALARDAIAVWPSSAHVERVRLAQVQALWLQGRWQESLEITLAQCASPHVSTRERGRLLAETASAQNYLAGPTAAAEQAATALAIGEQLDDDAIRCAALTAGALASYYACQYLDGVEMAERAVAIAERSRSDEPRRGHPHWVLGQVYVGLDRLEDAERTHRAGRQMGERLGTVWDASWYQAALAGRAWHAGDWDDSATEAETAISMAVEMETTLGRTYASSLLGLISLHRDCLADAVRHCELAEAELTASGPGLGGDWTPWLRGLILEAGGQQQLALQVLIDAAHRAEALGMYTSLSRIAPEVVRLALANGDGDVANRAALWCEQVASRAGTPSALGIALRCRGLIEGDVQLLVDSVETLRSSPRRIERAVALEDAGRTTGEAGRIDDAIPMLEEGLAIFATVGAMRDERRVLATLRRFGVKRGARGRRVRPATGWESLTSSELGVVRLASEGLTNAAIGSRLFISPHTVETHLRHAFSKMGVSNRVELATVAVRHDHSSST